MSVSNISIEDLTLYVQTAHEAFLTLREALTWASTHAPDRDHRYDGWVARAYRVLEVVEGNKTPDRDEAFAGKTIDEWLP